METLSAGLRNAYGKKDVPLDLPGVHLRLAVPMGAFSSARVDAGTRALLREMRAAQRRWGRALDLGCGYGPIALALAGGGLAERVVGVDRDAVAVAFAAENARRNGLADVEIRPGLAYAGLEGRRFDVIVSNVPAKAGRPVIGMLLLAAKRHLTEGGEVWIVVVEPLAAFVDDLLAGGAVEVPARVARARHVVYNYRFTRAEIPGARGEDVYVRRAGRFEWKGHAYSLSGFHGLGEFDSRHWVTDAIVEAFARRFGGTEAPAVTVCNPGPGHAAVLAGRVAESIGRMTLASRDGLALEAAGRNLVANGFTGELRSVHTADWPAAAAERPRQMVLATLDEKEGLEVNLHQLRGLLGAGHAVIAGCKSSFASRLCSALRADGHHAVGKVRRKGCSAFCLLPAVGG